jgi:uncharacterized protein YgiM (DUF1202 family)
MDLDPICGHGTARGTATVLYMRQTPEPQGQIVGTLNMGQLVDVWQTEGVWNYIQRHDTGSTGWSHSAYLQLLAPLQP